MKIDRREVLGTEMREDGLHIKLEAKPERVHVRYSFHFPDDQPDQDPESEAAENWPAKNGERPVEGTMNEKMGRT